MLKTAMLVSAIALGSAGFAQAADNTARPSTTTPPAAATLRAGPGTADANKLIGQDIKNAENQSIGEVKSVRIGADGKVNAVIVGVGGFLGLGEREVAVDWNSLNIADDGRKVSVAMTKEQLKALPEYKYPDASYRGRVFSETKHPAAAPGGTLTTADTKTTAVTPDTKRTDRATTAARGDFNAKGDISGNALIGASVKNAANETVGEVEDLFVDQAGNVKALIVSVGGAMGIGAKDVMMGWQDLKVGRQQDKVVLTTSATKDSLKAMPEYKKN